MNWMEKGLIKELPPFYSETKLDNKNVHKQVAVK